MDFSGCIDDDSFGPAVLGCRDNFDFTIKFENIFLSIIPASLFIVVALGRIIILGRRPEAVSGSILRGVKLAATNAYGALQLSLLVFSTDSTKPRALLVTSTVLSFCSSICIIGLSFLEHSRSARPSILLNAYLLLTVLFDVAQTRTLWLASTNFQELIFSRLFTVSVAVKAILIIIESQHKSRWVLWDVKGHSPEETSGIFGLSAFTWLLQMFLVGYTKILTLDDLFPLDGSMATEALQLRLMENLRSSKSKGQKRGFGLAKAMAKTLKIPLLLPIGPRAALIAFKFCQPFLINILLKYLEEPSDHASKNRGYGLIGATILIYTGIAVFTALYWYLHERTLCMSRGSLAGAVYRKTTEAKVTTVGVSAAITLMSADVERIRLGFLNLHEFWANSIEVGLAGWLLYRQLGAAVAAPLIIVLCCVIGGAFGNKFTGRRQRAWMNKIQKRVGLTANIISNMKHLKISGLAVPVEELIQNMRVDELQAASRFRTVNVIVIIFGYVPLALAPVVTFAVTSRTLDATTIFTSISYLLLLTDPLSYLFQNSPNLLAAFACFERIQTFLEKDPRADFRTPRLHIPDPELEKYGSSSEEKESEPEPLVTITNGNFGWETNKTTLKNINLEIPSSRLTMVVGPVASGKSTLCKVLLGEIPEYQAQITMNHSIASRQVGYCDQTPYLSNTSIRSNIIGFSPFNQQRYREVIEATMLEPDLAVLPKGDATITGSNGITLSGGQKQRVSIARALYLHTNFFVFDDILSGIDAITEEKVFTRIFGLHGLLRRRDATAVLCTNTVRRLPFANHIVALGMDGSIVEQGSFQKLLTNWKYVRDLGFEATDDIIREESYSSIEAEESTGTELRMIDIGQPVTQSLTDEKKRMNGDSAVYMYYIKSLGKRSIAAFLVFGVGWGFSYNFGNIWLTYWSKDIGSAHPRRTNSFYIGIYALLQLLYLASLLFSFMVCYRTMIRVSGSRLHKAALNTVINAPLRFFATTDTGLVTNLFSQDMTLIDNEMPIALTNLVLDSFNALGMAAVIATSSPFLAITYPFLFVVLYWIQKFYLRTSRQVRLLDLEAKGPLYTHFLDTIRGITTFRAFGWVQDGIDLNNRLLDTSQRPTYLLAMVQRWLGFILQMLVAILAVVVVTLATQVRSSTAMTGASLVTLMTFGDVLKYIIRWWTQLETSIGAVSRLKSFGEKVRSEGLDGEDVKPPREWPLRGAIEINGVSASYGDLNGPARDLTSNDRISGEASQTLALKDLTLSIQPGEKVAICGQSGSGKSSTILLLLRLLEPVSSYVHTMTIDDIPLHKLDRQTLRERIIAVPQDSVFLPDGSSVMANLDPLNTSNEAECRAVLETVGVWKFMEERGGLNEEFSADTLSQGQKQLFSLARAVLKRRIRERDYEVEFGVTTSVQGRGGILLLDEVSSSLDQDTDRAMQTVIKEEFESYTIIMVSHRLEIVMDFDTVVVMEKGSVVESGNPRTLVDTNGSRFKELWLAGNKS